MSQITYNGTSPISKSKMRSDNPLDSNAEQDLQSEQPLDDLQHQSDQLDGNDEPGGSVNGQRTSQQQEQQVEEPLTMTVQNGIVALEHRKSVLLQKVRENHVKL